MTIDKSQPPELSWFLNHPIRGLYYALIGLGIMVSLFLGVFGVGYGVGRVANNIVLGMQLDFVELVLVGFGVGIGLLAITFLVYALCVLGVAGLWLLDIYGKYDD